MLLTALKKHKFIPLLAGKLKIQPLCDLKQLTMGSLTFCMQWKDANMEMVSRQVSIIAFSDRTSIYAGTCLSLSAVSTTG